MTVYELMAKLGAAGIKLWVEDGQLKFKAPKGALTADLKAELVASKQDVIEFLSQTRLESESARETIPRVDRSEPIPLSHAQQRLWFIEQLTPGSSTFHIPAALYLTGILDYKALESAFVLLLQRHEALRTVFVTEDDDARQIVLDIDRFAIPLEDLTAVPADEREIMVKARVEKEVRRPFVLDHGPLVRAHLYKLDDNHHGLVVTMHHIVTDGWSMGIFVKEISALYAAQRMGSQAPLPKLEIQYPDFAHWQRQWLQGDELERQLRYWSQNLGQAPLQTSIPFDRPRPPLQTLNGATLDVKVDADLTAGLKRLAREFDTTLYVILMAAYKIVLAKWNRQDDLCVGMPVAGRTRPEVEGLIGFFVNTLVIRSRLSPSVRIEDFIRLVKEQILSAQAHQDLPFEAIVEELNVPRNLSYAPMYQVALSLTGGDGTAKKVVMGGLEITPMDIELVAARLDLTLMLADQGELIEGMAEYNVDLYDRQTIERFMRHFNSVLSWFVEDRTLSVAALQLENEANLLQAIPGAAGAEALLPLIPMQRDFVLDSLREPESNRNSIGSAVQIPLAIDEQRWREALQAVIHANPIWRSRIVACDVPGADPLYAAIFPDVEPAIEILDWRKENLTDTELQDRVTRLALPAWDVESGILRRHYLIRTGDAEYWAVSAAHHSISDGVSKLCLLQQTLDAYRKRPLNEVPLAVLRDWSIQRIAQNDTEQGMAFWQQQFANVEPVATRTAEPGKACFSDWTLDQNDFGLLRDWCAGHGVSSTNYFRTLYALALQNCYFHSGDFALIEALAGRQFDEGFQALANSAGCYFQFVPFVQHYNETETGLDTFSGLLANNRKWKKSVGEHQYLSMMARRRFYDSNALEFQFNHRMAQVSNLIEFEGHQLQLKPIQPDNAGVVKLLITPDDHQVTLRLSFREHEFEGFNLLQRMQHVHQQLMSGVDRLDQLQWLLVSEQQQQSDRMSGSHVTVPETVLQAYADTVRRYAQQPAVLFGEQVMSWSELDQRSNRIAAALVVRGAGRGQRIAFCMSRQPDLVAVMLGIVKSGAAYIPIDSHYPDERIRFIVRDAEATLLITDQEPLLDSDRAITVTALMDAHSGSGAAVPDLPLPSSDDILYYVYTSGSTGQPKGAGVRHGGEANLIHWYRDLLDITVEDRVLLMSSIGFDLTQKNLFVCFSSGAALVIPTFDEYDPERYAAVVDQQGVSVINCAPSALYPLIDSSLPQYPYPSLRHVILGGEPIRTDALSSWLNREGNPIKLTNSYGPTECTDVAVSYTVDQLHTDIQGLPIGNAINNTHLYIVNSQGRLMPTGSVGELYIAGAGVGTGYWKRDDLNATAFSDCPYNEGQWYATGDLCWLDDAGVVHYVGRKDFQVKLRGLRIEPQEIDNVLKALDKVQDALTLVKDDQLVSYVLMPRAAGEKSSASKHIDTSDLKDYLRDRVPEFMVPAAIVALERWPLTPNGKIDRKALPEPSLHAGADFVAPRNESESLIADIWCQVLKLSNISIKANFFESGGHSLLATQIVSRIRKELGVELSVRALFEAPTIEKLVQKVNLAAVSGHLDAAPPLQALDTPNRNTLSFAQYRLWFVDQLNQGSSEYNLPSAFRIEGALDLDVLDKVFGEIVARHEVLRTNFAVDEGNPRLVVNDPQTWQSDRTDLSALSEQQQQVEITRLVDEDAARIYSLENDSLFTTRILTLNDREHILLLNMHHIVSDGWSLGVLVSEIQTLYVAFSQGQGSPLPPLPIQYSDFAVWQRNWLQGDALEKMKDYWRNALQGAPDVLRLPTDKPRPKFQTFNGAHHEVRLGEPLSQELNRFCDRHDLTPFMVLMGAYQILLSRYANQNDVCVGIPIAGRNRSELEGLIGFFINGLVIRTRLQGNPVVLDYLKQVKDVSLGAYAHQDMPADVLLDTLKMDRNADTSPGAQVGFALQNVAQESLSADMGGLSIEPVAREHKTSKYELSLILQEGEQGFAGVAEYNTDLFLDDTIGRMMSHFKRILQQMLRAPDMMVDHIEMVDPDELYRLLQRDPDQVELRPLSPMQRDMYLDSLMEPETLKNSLGYHFITDGQFDVDLWVQASQHIVNQQPMLRSHILRSELPFTEVAYLEVEHSKSVQVQIEDRSDRVTTDEEAAALAQQLIWRPYDIEGNLSEYFVFRLDRDRHLVVFRMNHIVLDGAGMAVHLLESIRAAEALARQETSLPAPDVFADYVRDNRLRTDTTEVISFWQHQGRHSEALDFSLPPVLSSGSSSRPASARTESSLRLGDTHWQQIQTFCKDNRITPSLYFKALYGLLISVYCRSEADFIVSEVVAGRVGQHKRAFGNYFQVLPIIFPQDLFDGNTPLQAVFDHIRQYRKSLRSNANVSLMTQRHTLPQGRLNFMFNYYNFIPSVELFGVSLKLKAYPQVQDGPVQFVVHEQDGWVDLNLIYLSGLFDDLDFLQRLEILSEQVLAGVDRLSGLNLLLPGDQALTSQEHASKQPDSRPLPQPHVQGNSILPHIAAQESTRTAVRMGRQELTYGDLARRSDHLAYWLAEQGIQSGQRVAICLDRSPDLVVAVLAVLKAGAAYVPIDAGYPADRLAFIVEDSAAPVLISQQCVVQRLQESGVNLNETQVLQLDNQLHWLETSAVGLPQADERDAFYVVYTSGSTGQPKGAQVTHGSVVNLQNWYLSATGLSAQDRVLLMSSTGFDLTQKNLFAPLLVGATLVIPEMDDYDVDVLRSTLTDQSITLVNCAPSAFYPLLETVPTGIENLFPALRYLVLGGEPIRLSALEPWLSQSGCTLINSYGPTECTDVVASYAYRKEDHFPLLPIGRPIPNTQLYVVDRMNHALPAGLVGELCISGRGVGPGYLQRDDLNAAAFQSNPFGGGRWYRTGDLVRRWPDGNLEYIGRKDFQIKLRGLRIELGEIEAALERFSGIEDSLIQVRDERLVAWVLTRQSLDEAALKQHLRGQLPDYMVPAVLVPVSVWPLTPNGKIDRSALPDPEHSGRPPYVAPRNETEEKLAQIWSEILGVEQIGVNDNFFDLGGHSLLAARAVAKFRQAFGVDIQLRSLFELHTIADIAQFLDTMMWAAQSADQADSVEDSGRDEGFL